MADPAPAPHVRRRVADGALVVLVGTVDLVFWGGYRDLSVGGVLPVWVVPVASVGLCAALLWRHRFPYAVWAAAWAYTGMNLLLPRYYPFACLFVATYALATRLSAPAAQVLLAATMVPFGWYSYHSALGAPGDNDLAQFLAAAATWTVLLGVIWGLGRLAYTRDQHARAEQARLAAEAERALAAERLRLARELHDSVSGAVAGMILHAGAARAVSTGDDPRVRTALEVIEEAGARAMAELHTLLGLLRSAESGPDPRPRFDTVDELIRLSRKGGTAVRAEIIGTPRELPPEADLAAYRIVQESLTNVIKHAPGARVTLTIAWRDRTLDLTVRSTAGRPAPGAGVLSSGHGLRGLRERVEALGGSMDAGPDGAGWRVHAEIPAAVGTSAEDPAIEAGAS